MDDVAIKVDHVSKKFCKSMRRSMFYGVMDIGRNMLGISSRPDQLRRNEFWAVDDVSFEVRKGKTLGIIGPNGSGKTTLLSMLSGIYMPDKGKISIVGKTGALISIGAGFHQQLSGRENVYVEGAILGLTKRETDEKFQAIADFAGIGDFIDSPVKFYSSGMLVRLGFSVAVNIEPDVLLVDEVLAVGDMNFRRRSIERMFSFKGKSTIVFISHSMDSVSSLCDRVIWMDKGKIREEGDASKVIAGYTAEVNRDLGQSTNGQLRVMRRGSGEARFTRVEVLDEGGNSCREFHTGDTIRIRAAFEADKRIMRPSFRFAIREVNSRALVTVADARVSNLPDVLPVEGVIECVFEDIQLRPNAYCLYLVLTSLDYNALAYDVWDDVETRFIVLPTEDDLNEGYIGGQNDMVKLPFNFELRPLSTT